MCAAPALASDYCDEMWFTRNLIFDRAGYCFGSPLGQAVFDNSDCSTKSPKISAADKQIIANIKSEESRVVCKINTKAVRRLNIHDINFRKSVTPIPVPDAHGFGCMGWKGAAFSLFRGADVSGPAVAEVRAGEDIVVLHWSGPPGWTFLTVGQDGATRAQGWAYNVPMTSATCTQMAG